MTRLVVDLLTVRREGALVLDRISFAARAGEFVAIVGPNGAGKSTLLRALAGLEPENADAVRLNDRDVAALKPRERARALAYLPQAREVGWAISAETVVALGRFAFGAPHRLGAADAAAVDEAMAATDCLPFRRRIMATLSGGEQARIHLARALAAQTRVLIADEPTAALDIRHQILIAQAMQAKAKADGLVVAAVHDIGFARAFATRAIVLDRGRIAADGEPAAALSATTLGRVFGVSANGDGWRLADHPPTLFPFSHSVS